MAKYNKEEILDMGIEMMRRNGYHGTGIQQVLKACKIPKGSFYNFFESKQDFALQAIDRYANENIQALQTISQDGNLGPIDKLRKFFSSMTDFYKKKNYEMTCLMSIISFEMGTVDPIISARIEEKFNRIKALMAVIIEKGQEKEEIKNDLSPKDLSDYLINSFNGALITMKYERSARAIRQFLDVNLSFISV